MIVRWSLAELPAVPHVTSNVFINKSGAESGLGMCGVLRPILNLESVWSRRG